MKILIVEDDKRIARPIAEDFGHQHYIVDLVEDGREALSITELAEYDLVLLDVMLPGVDGIEVCRTMRARGYQGCVMMLTARSAKEDKILGLDSGADDYIVKPFDLDELNARVRALLRRANAHARSELVFDELSVDLRACTVRYRHCDVSLSPTEYRLLVQFMRHPGQVFTKHQLIEKLWAQTEAPTDAVIKAHIKGLRKKLEQAGAPRNLVETVYGFGYRLNRKSR